MEHVLKRSKLAFCEVLIFLTWHKMMSLDGKPSTSDASSSCFVAGAVFQRPQQNGVPNLVARFDVMRSKFSSRYSLASLRVSNRSPCGAVRSLISLAQPSRHLRVPDRFLCGAVLILRSLVQPARHFGRARSFFLWHSAHLGSLVQPSRHFTLDCSGSGAVLIRPGGLHTDLHKEIF